MSTDYRQLKPFIVYQRQRMRLRRMGMIRAVVVIGLVLQLSVFWYLQIVRGPDLRQEAEENRLHRRIERALRGQLTDSHGEVLVTNKPTFAVIFSPQRTKDPEREITFLARVIGEQPETMLTLFKRARGRQTRFQPVMLVNDVDYETAARISAHRLELPSIDIEMTAKRGYVYGPEFAHVLGYVSEANEEELANRGKGLTMGDRVGRTGAERVFDQDLRGIAGTVLEEVNAVGRPLGVVSVQRPPRNGRALPTTLDLAMQKDVVEAFGDSVGAAVFLEPRTGAVRAFYSAPTFDPNLFGGRLSPTTWAQLSQDPDRPLHNRASGSAYAPGSTFKVVMAVAALEEKVVTPGETVGCGGSATFYGRVFNCWRKGGHGGIAIQDAITQSCNVFFYNMGKRLGAERIAKWAHAFGLGQPSGLRFEHENVGIVPTNEWKKKVRGEPVYPGEVISIAIGQGLVQVSPVQNALVAAAIANGGNRVFAHLVDRPDMFDHPIPMGASPETLSLVRAGMINVVESGFGTARRARVEGYRLAGKTGTAQNISREADEQIKDNAWFIGFGPVDDPQLAWGVLIERGGHGGETAAPIVGLVVKRYLERLGNHGQNRQVARIEEHQHQASAKEPSPVVRVDWAHAGDVRDVALAH